MTSTILQVLEKIVKSILGFALLLILQRKLGTDFVGIFSYYLALYTIMIQVLMGVGSQILVRAYKLDLVEKQIKLAYFISIATILIIGIILYSSLLKTDLLFLIIIFLSLPFLYFFKGRWQLEAQERFAFLAAVDIVVALIFFALKLYIVSNNYSVFLLISSFALEYVSLSILYKIITGATEKLLVTNKDKFKEHLVDIAKVILSSIAIIVYMKLDIIMLKNLSTESETGLYAIASRFVEAGFILPLVLISISYPRMIDAYNRRQFVQISKLFLVLVLTSIVIVGLSLLLVPLLVSYLFDIDAQDFNPIFQTLIPSVIFVAIGTLRARISVIIERPELELICNLIGCLINFILNWYLIPRNGAIGAAYATLISLVFMSVVFTLSNPVHRRTIKAIWRAHA